MQVKAGLMVMAIEKARIHANAPVGSDGSNRQENRPGFYHPRPRHGAQRVSKRRENHRVDA